VGESDNAGGRSEKFFVSMAYAFGALGGRAIFRASSKKTTEWFLPLTSPTRWNQLQLTQPEPGPSRTTINSGIRSVPNKETYERVGDVGSRLLLVETVRRRRIDLEADVDPIWGNFEVDAT